MLHGVVMVRRAVIFGLVAATIAGTSPAAAAAAVTVRSGIEAWQNGDAARAVGIWRSLADKGDQDAAFNLGQAYRLGRGVPADSGEAKRWFQRAARTGHLEAQVSLGLLLFDVGDRAGALDWLGRAADRGEPRAMLVTGTALFNGDGLRRDAIRGYAYVSRSAAQGLEPAKSTLADMDKVMSVDDRKKGVAMALAAVNEKPAARPIKFDDPTPTRSVPPPRVSVAATPRPVPPPSSAAPAGGWRIQLGAFGNRTAAQSLFARLGPKLGGAQAYYIPVGSMTRLQAGPFSRAGATSACLRLRPQPCFPVAAR